MPVVIEKKELLNGAIHLYECDPILLNRNFGIIKYVLPKPQPVASLLLPKNTVTLAFYWRDRPYTLYRWYYQQRNLGNYFNIADRIVLKETEFQWRDLVVDILIDENQTVEILDRNELPVGLSASLQRYIDSATEHITTNYMAIFQETDRILHEQMLLPSI
ncbi:MAG: DUF402 domain-containing protein [Fidelibacterota bacterium]